MHFGLMYDTEAQLTCCSREGIGFWKDGKKNLQPCRKDLHEHGFEATQTLMNSTFA